MRQMKQFVLLSAVAVCSTGCVAGTGPARPRGVGPEFAKYYKDPSTFSCIFNPSIKIPLSAVNDDYCDCPDGSDEPGTAACAQVSELSPTVPNGIGDKESNRSAALPGFYCVNKGHRPSYVPTIRVNDGVCDYDLCCDGSDEWAAPGGQQCENRCKTIGAAWAKEEVERQKAMSAALKQRKKLVAEGEKATRTLEGRVGELRQQIQETEARVTELAAKLSEARRQDAARPKARKGKVNELAHLAKERVNSLRNGLLEAKRQRDGLGERVTELETILATFKEEYNPNFNDEGVKRAVRSYEDYAAREKEEPDDNELDELAKEDSAESGIDFAKWEKEKDAPTEGLGAAIEQTLASGKSLLANYGILPPAGPDSDEDESQSVCDARTALLDAESALNDRRSDLRNAEGSLTKDYGPDGVLRALEGQCISRDAGEYTYEHCWLDQTRQRSKRGGATVGMGKFAGFATVDVDEPAVGGRVVARPRLALEYTGGSVCWNGPARSTRVVLECGGKDEILKVFEEDRCVYTMEVTTPAVCGGGKENKEGKEGGEQKDEL